MATDADWTGLRFRPIEIPLLSVTYLSESLIEGPEDGWAAEVEEILRHSRRKNQNSAVTGALFLTTRHFVQVLEGPVPSVSRTLERIQRDPRHRILQMEQRPLEVRRFGEWSMAYLGPDGEPEPILPLARPPEWQGRAAAAVTMMQYLVQGAA